MYSGLMPRAVFAGVFLVVGWASCEGNPILHKTLFLVRDPRMTPKDHPLRDVSRVAIAGFVAIQWLFMGATVAISQTIGESVRRPSLHRDSSSASASCYRISGHHHCADPGPILPRPTLVQRTRPREAGLSYGECRDRLAFHRRDAQLDVVKKAFGGSRTKTSKDGERLARIVISLRSIHPIAFDTPTQRLRMTLQLPRRRLYCDANSKPLPEANRLRLQVNEHDGRIGGL